MARPLARRSGRPAESAAHGATRREMGTARGPRGLHHVERRLEEVEARLRLITEELDDVYAEVGPGGAFTYASPNIERLLGLTPEALIGRSFEEFVHPDDREDLLAGLSDTQETASGRRTFRLRGPEGRWRWVEARGRAYRLSSGEFRFAGITRDMTTAREAERRFRLLAEHGRDLITEFDDAGRFRWVSPNHERMMGYTEDALLGRLGLDFIHPEDARSFRDIVEREDEGLLELTLRTRAADGRFRWVQCIGNTYRTTDDEVRSLWLSRDVTERIEAKVRAEELARRLEGTQERERAELARDVHDELGQGLTGLMLGLSAMLAECELDADSRERVQGMKEEIERLDDSLGRITRRLWPATLEFGLVSAIEIHARDLASASGWQLELDLDPRTPTLDREREAAIFRIAQEALTNVARHAGARRVEVSLRARKGELHLEVRDDGRGLPEDVSRPGHHGLAGMRERALAWGGRLAIERAASGTVVRAELPLDLEQDP